MAVNELNGSYSTFTNDQKQRLLPHVSQCYGKWIPLYTHPVKDLTDEEIAEIAMQCSDMDEYGNSQLKEYDFAKAILLKAQER